MRVLFVHQNFPAQYRHVARALARRPGMQVIGLGENAGEPLPGVQHLRYKAPSPGAKETHRYVRRFESAVYRGQQVARAALNLKGRGFEPDIVCCHPGWGRGCSCAMSGPPRSCCSTGSSTTPPPVPMSASTRRARCRWTMPAGSAS